MRIESTPSRFWNEDAVTVRSRWSALGTFALAVATTLGSFLLAS